MGPGPGRPGSARWHAANFRRPAAAAAGSPAPQGIGGSGRTRPDLRADPGDQPLSHLPPLTGTEPAGTLLLKHLPPVSLVDSDPDRILDSSLLRRKPRVESSEPRDQHEPEQLLWRFEYEIRPKRSDDISKSPPRPSYPQPSLRQAVEENGQTWPSKDILSRCRQDGLGLLGAFG